MWAVICGVAFIGVQYLVAIGIALFMAAGIEFWGWRETLYDDNTVLVTIAAIVASIIVLLGIFWYLDRAPKEQKETPPPPPPTFDQNE